MNAIFWLCAIVTLAGALTILGFSIVVLRAPGQERIAALYTFGRSFALAVVSNVPICTSST
jgi:hypothetical protein